MEPIAFPKAGGLLLLPKLIMPEPKEKAPACLTPLVLAKLDPMDGVFAGDAGTSCSFALSASSAFDPPKLKRYVLLEALFAIGDDGVPEAEPKENGVVEVLKDDAIAGGERDSATAEAEEALVADEMAGADAPLPDVALSSLSSFASSSSSSSPSSSSSSSLFLPKVE